MSHTSSQSENFDHKSSQNSDLNHNPSAWQHSAVIPADKLSLVFDSNQTDDVLFAQLKLERKLYRELSTAEDASEFEQRLLKIIQEWGLDHFSFLRLDHAGKNNGKTLMQPKILLASYPHDDKPYNNIIIHGTGHDPKARHMSMLYHFISSTPAEALEHSESLFAFIVTAGSDSYITTSGPSRLSRLVSMSSLSGQSHEELKDSNDASSIKDHQHLIDLLANTIEGIGTTKFAEFSKGHKESKKIKINPRPLRLLNTLAHKDVTLNQAADLLCLSVDTVNKHVAAAKAALGTTTIAGTVWKAVKEGLIDESTG